MMKTACFLTIFLLAPVGMLAAADATAPPEIDRQTLDEWAAPYRGWHYWPEPVIPADPQIPDVPPAFEGGLCHE